MMCIFCNFDTEQYIIHNNLSFAIFDKYPVNQGHVLIIPFRHAETYFDLTEQELCAMWNLSLTIKLILDKQYQPNGYNIGFNVKPAGGQTINHVHMHVIPRYRGDIDDPVGGIRGVIPNKQKY